MAHDYDLIVLGSGPAGQKAAIQAAKLGRRAVVVEKRDLVGGACTNTGTIPSKTLREAVLYLTGLSQRTIYGQAYRLKDDITVDDLFSRTNTVMGREIDVIRAQLARNHVVVALGSGRFVDPHTVLVTTSTGDERRLTASVVVIAVGTNPTRPATVAFDEDSILDSDGILRMGRIRGSLVVVGAGVIGIEYASMCAALGTKVTVVEKRQRLLEFCDDQIVEALQYHLRDLGVTFRFGEQVTGVEKREGGTISHLASGKRIAADAVMYSAGRQGATDGLDLEAAGLSTDDRGRIVVDEHYRTPVPHIYAVGDVIGFPSLAATSMDQGRLAPSPAFGEPARGLQALQPIGIYTVPEISYCGLTEAELTGKAVPYE